MSNWQWQNCITKRRLASKRHFHFLPQKSRCVFAKLSKFKNVHPSGMLSSPCPLPDMLLLPLVFISSVRRSAATNQAWKVAPIASYTNLVVMKGFYSIEPQRVQHKQKLVWNTPRQLTLCIVQSLWYEQLNREDCSIGVHQTQCTCARYKLMGWARKINPWPPPLTCNCVKPFLILLLETPCPSVDRWLVRP